MAFQDFSKHLRLWHLVGWETGGLTGIGWVKVQLHGAGDSGPGKPRCADNCLVFEHPSVLGCYPLHGNANLPPPAPKTGTSPGRKGGAENCFASRSLFPVWVYHGVCWRLLGLLTARPTSSLHHPPSTPMVQAAVGNCFFWGGRGIQWNGLWLRMM